jgi:predicted ATPase
VSAYTHRLTDGYFAFKYLGPTQIKGVEEPLPIYEVLGTGPLRTRLQVSATRRGLTRFVGRQSEMEQLQRALEHAKAGYGQVVGTMGEPGLGKSRLFHELVGATGRSLLPTDLHIPTTVQGILAARIDRLTPDEKALLQQLAVIGRQFPLSLIRQVLTQPEADLYRLLASLQYKEFLYEQPAFPESEYIFKHALTQEVAYGTVLQEQRKLLHERTGQALEALYTTTLHEHYSDLAHHYQRSANTEKAITYLQLAGQQAAQRSANTETINYLTAALDLLLARPETPERAVQELPLQIALGNALMATKGYAAPEVGEAYTRARELCRQVGDTPQLFRVLVGLLSFYLVRAELQTAHELAEQFFNLAQSGRDPYDLLLAHYMLGDCLFHLGELASARTHFEQTIALYNLQPHHSPTFGIDPGVAGRSYAAHTLWLLGYPEQALQKSREALALAQEFSHPFSLAFSLDYAVLLHRFRRERRAVREQASAAIALCTEQSFAYYLAWGEFMQGWALTEQGEGEPRVAQMRQSLAAMRSTGAELRRPYYLALVAEACGKVGQAEEGLVMVTEALATVEKTAERWCEAEVWRIKGELLLAQEGLRLQAEGSREKTEEGLRLQAKGLREKTKEAEECFLQAIEIAQKQQAKSLELRAVMSLARLWQSQGKSHDARELLAPIYGWFAEGFDTKDLQEVQALLEEFTQ